MSTPQTFSQLASTVTQYINTGTGLLIVVAIAILFAGIGTRLFRERQGGIGQWSGYLIWGVLIIFFMVTIVGLVGILQQTVFGGTL